jgi:hypothetical protein
MRVRLVIGVICACVSSIALAQPPAACAPAGDIQFVCGQNGPEDLVVVPGGQWVVASAFGGGGVKIIRVRDRTSLVAYPSASAKDRFDAKAYAGCPGPLDTAAKAKFATHGLSLEPGKNGVHRLLVVGHGSREAVEVFELDARPSTPTLTWIGCAVASDPIGLNSVRWLADGGFVASNFLARNIDAESRARMLAGERNGELWEWHAASGWKKVSGSESAGANGLEISGDGKWFYVAAWGTQSFFRLSRGGSKPSREEIPLGFRVDNLRWAKDGTLLAAGQRDTAPGSQSTVIVKVDTKTMKVQSVLERPNVDAFGAGTVAVEVGNDLWVGSFRGDRIAVFRR